MADHKRPATEHEELPPAKRQKGPFTEESDDDAPSMPTADKDHDRTEERPKAADGEENDHVSISSAEKSSTVTSSTSDEEDRSDKQESENAISVAATVEKSSTTASSSHDEEDASDKQTSEKAATADQVADRAEKKDAKEIPNGPKPDPSNEADFDRRVLEKATAMAKEMVKADKPSTTSEEIKVYSWTEYEDKRSQANRIIQTKLAIIETHESTIQSLKYKLADLRKENRHLESTNTNLTTSLSIAENSAKEAKAHEAKFCKEQLALIKKDKSDEVKEKLATQKSRYEKLLADEKKKAEDKLEKGKKASPEDKKRMKELEKEAKEAKEKNRTNRVLLNSAEIDIEKMKRNIDRYQAERRAVREMIPKKDEEISNLKETIVSLTTEMGKLKSAFHHRLAADDQRKSQQIHDRRSIKHFASIAEKAQGRVGGLEERMRALEEENRALREGMEVKGEEEVVRRE